MEVKNEMCLSKNDAFVEMKRWREREREGETSGGKAGRGAEDGGRCLERGSGVRDWKTEEARKMLRRV